MDLSKFEADDSIVQVRVEILKTVANRLSVNVLVYPKDSLYDKNFGVLKADAAVRLYSGKGNAAEPSDLGDLQYPVGKAPGASHHHASRRMAIPATGHSTRTRTDEISAVVFTGRSITKKHPPVSK